METEPKIILVQENNVEVLYPKTVVDTTGQSFQTFDHNDQTLKESFGKDGIADRISKLNEALANWQDQKWVDEFVAKQIAGLQKQIATYTLVDEKLKLGELTPKGE